MTTISDIEQAIIKYREHYLQRVPSPDDKKILDELNMFIHDACQEPEISLDSVVIMNELRKIREENLGLSSHFGGIVGIPIISSMQEERIRKAKALCEPLLKQSLDNNKN